MRMSDIIGRIGKRRSDASGGGGRVSSRPETEDAPEGQEKPSGGRPERRRICVRHLDVELTEEQWISMKDFIRREIRHFDGKPEKTGRTLMLLSALRKTSLALQAARREAYHE